MLALVLVGRESFGTHACNRRSSSLRDVNYSAVSVTYGRGFAVDHCNHEEEEEEEEEV